MSSSQSESLTPMSKRKKTLVTLTTILALLVLVRALLPIIIERSVNARLNESDYYDSRIGDVDLSLLRGAYSIDDVEIIKSDGDVPVPLFSAKSVEFSLLWSALFRAAVVAEIDFYQPVINIVDSDEQSRKQTGEQVSWLSILDELLPLRIDRAAIHEGELHFRNFDTDPPIDVYINDLELNAINLTNSRDLADSLVATVDVKGKAVDSADLSAVVKLDPSELSPTFDADVKLLDLKLVSIGPFIANYAPFDVEGGELDLVAELAASGGQIEGYVKPLVEGLEVFTWKGDFIEDKDNPFIALWESVVEFTGEIFENSSSDKLASTIPIEGSLDNPDVGVLATIANLFENAFVKAYRARFNNDVSLDFESSLDTNLD